MALTLYMPLVDDLSIVVGTGPVSYTRSTTATYVDKEDGLIKTAAIDVARFETLGVLLEGASTNTLLRSEEFDNASWVASGVASITANDTTAPDGATTADQLSDDGSGGSGDVNTAQAITVGSGDNAFSLFAKKDQVDWVILRTENFDASANGSTWFNLANGTIGTESSSHTATIESFADGWFRCTIFFSTTADLDGLVKINAGQADGDFSVDLDSTSSIFIWGAQLELKAFASSYIPTTTVAVARGSDELSVPPSNIAAIGNDYSVSVTASVIGAYVNDSTGLFPRIYQIEGTNLRFFRFNVANLLLRGGHGAPNSLSVSATTINTPVNGVFSVDSTNQIVYFNGVNESQLATGTPSGSKTAINIGRRFTDNYLYGHLKEFKIYDTAIVPVAPPPATYLLAGYAPNIVITDNVAVDVPDGLYSLTGYAPNVATTSNVAVDVPDGLYVIIGHQPVVVIAGGDVVVSVGAGEYDFIGYEPVIPATGGVWTKQDDAITTWVEQ